MTGGGSFEIIPVNGDEELGTKTVCLLVVCCVCLSATLSRKSWNRSQSRASEILPSLAGLTGVGLNEAEPLGLDEACVYFACFVRIKTEIERCVQACIEEDTHVKIEFVERFCGQPVRIQKA